MSIQSRLKAIQKALNPKQPLLAMQFLKPTQAQLDDIAHALKIGRVVVVFHPLNAGIWLSLEGGYGWWEDGYVDNN